MYQLTEEKVSQLNWDNIDNIIVIKYWPHGQLKLMWNLMFQNVTILLCGNAAIGTKVT